MMNDIPFQPQPPVPFDDTPVNSQSPFIGTMPQPDITPANPVVPPQPVPTVPPMQHTQLFTPPSPVQNDLPQSLGMSPLSPSPTVPMSSPMNGGISAPSASPSPSSLPNVPGQSPMQSWAGPQLSTDQFPSTQFGAPTPVTPISTPKTLDDLVPSTSPIPQDVAPVPPQIHDVEEKPTVELELEHLVKEVKPAEPLDVQQNEQNHDDINDFTPPVVPSSSDLPQVPSDDFSSPVTLQPQNNSPISFDTPPLDQPAPVVHNDGMSQDQDQQPSVPLSSVTDTPQPIPSASLTSEGDQPQDMSAPTQDDSSDAVEGEVIPPAPAKGVNLSAELSAIVEKYQVNQGKPHFPLNTLRLVYLIFAESVSSDNQDLVKRRADDILKIIPKVQELFDLRSSHRAENTDATLETEWQAVQEKLNEIYQIVDTPLIRQSAEFLFSYVFPLQDTLLLSLYEDIAGEKKFGIQDIYSIFHIRSMDSIFYSGLVGGIVSRDIDQSQLPANFQLAINYKLNALYQLNDLVDSIVYAKEDMENKNFSPFELVRKVAEDGTKARELITSMAAAFEKRIASFPLSEKTEKLINDFGHQLVGVIGS